MTLDHTYLTCSTYSNLSWLINSVGQILLLLRKSAPDFTSQPSWVAQGTHLSFSPNTAIEAVGLSQASFDGRLLGLLDPYHQHAIGTFNTCSRGPTHRSLTDKGRGYNLGGAGLPHHTTRPSQLTVSTFHLRTLPGLRLSIKSLPPDLKGDQALNLTSRSLYSISTIIYHLSIAWANDVPPRDRANKGNLKGSS
jgi:hypothetical protein